MKIAFIYTNTHTHTHFIGTFHRQT